MLRIVPRFFLFAEKASPFGCDARYVSNPARSARRASLPQQGPFSKSQPPFHQGRDSQTETTFTRAFQAKAAAMSSMVVGMTLASWQRACEIRGLFGVVSLCPSGDPRPFEELGGLGRHSLSCFFLAALLRMCCNVSTQSNLL